MKCRKCQSDRIVYIGAHQIPEECLQVFSYEGGGCTTVHLPSVIGESDSIQFKFCAACGHIHGTFPITLKMNHPDNDVELE
ncbi:MAG: hypothetical protein E6R04_02555 [Spirochaetes bacterium]|nr:MAG: hypothetical protein E6R04_02555 [Spirochaetota bacterium]